MYELLQVFSFCFSSGFWRQSLVQNSRNNFQVLVKKPFCIFLILDVSCHCWKHVLWKWRKGSPPVPLYWFLFLHVSCHSEQLSDVAKNFDTQWVGVHVLMNMMLTTRDTMLPILEKDLTKTGLPSPCTRSRDDKNTHGPVWCGALHWPCSVCLMTLRFTLRSGHALSSLSLCCLLTWLKLTILDLELPWCRQMGCRHLLFSCGRGATFVVTLQCFLSVSFSIYEPKSHDFWWLAKFWDRTFVFGKKKIIITQDFFHCPKNTTFAIYPFLGARVVLGFEILVFPKISLLRFILHFWVFHVILSKRLNCFCRP